MDSQGRTTIFRDVAEAHASNGLMFDHAGRLIACESGARRVTRTEKDGSITVLADHYNGKRFNTPNDLCMDSKGRIYFTDPRYGPRDGMEIMQPSPTFDEAPDKPGQPVHRELKAVEGVYRIEMTPRFVMGVDGICRYIEDDCKTVTRLMLEGVERPNGILISPDDHYLYIADNNNNNHGGSRKLLRFTLNKDGTVKPGTRKVLFDWQDSRGPDGMKMDKQGRFYVAAGINKANEYETTRFKAGCYILSPGGRLIDFIPTGPDETCNCTFGGNHGRTLFITSGSHLWSVPLK
jgi:gluconolactonase